MSWRDSASERAQEDLDSLLNTALGFAQHQLAKRGAFYPYAAAIRVDGEPEMIAAMPAEGGEHPQAADVLASCFSALTDRRDSIRAGAVVSDVRTRDTEAIRVDLEHGEGQALAVLLPYSRANDDSILYGEVQAQVGQRQIWV